MLLRSAGCLPVSHATTLLSRFCSDCVGIESSYHSFQLMTIVTLGAVTTVATIAD